MTADLVTRRAGETPDARVVTPDLAELCRLHGVGLDAVERSRDVEDLIERAIAAFEKGPDGDSRQDLRALVTFACRVSVLHERAAAARPAGPAAAADDPRLARIAELLRSVGALIHQINNPLTALVGRAQLLRMQTDLPPRSAHGAVVMEESSLRIADLVRELAAAVKEARGLAGPPAPPGDVPQGASAAAPR